jgi:hypothetical protein
LPLIFATVSSNQGHRERSIQNQVVPAMLGEARELQRMQLALFKSLDATDGPLGHLLKQAIRLFQFISGELPPGFLRTFRTATLASSARRRTWAMTLALCSPLSAEKEMTICVLEKM